MTTTTLTSPVPAQRRRGATIALWASQVLLAALFVGGGMSKLAGSPEMVDMFADIGAGQWLRYLVGACEVGGAIGLLIPRLTAAAALGLVGLMVGATVTNVVILDASPVLPMVLLLVASAIAWVRR
jgi:uncharacterized membrane protein YphA (DoxX/SURF4 family)